MKHKGYYLLFLGLVLTDQFTKQIFMSSFDLGQSVVVNPFLSWTYVQNTGAAFSFLAGGGMMQKSFLLVVSILGFYLDRDLDAKDAFDLPSKVIRTVSTSLRRCRQFN